MKPNTKKISKDDKLLLIFDAHVKKEANDFATQFKEGIAQDKINDYMRETYITPNPNLRGSDIINKYFKLEERKQMTTKKDVDDFFKKHLPSEQSNLKKLVDADALHLKHHPSPDDKMELKEDKNKLRLLKYIDTKWFDEPEYIKIKKIKLLKNRVIKKINTGEFTHKKEVNKYIKAYNAKNFNPDKYI